jgi:hypothetical protein
LLVASRRPAPGLTVEEICTGVSKFDPWFIRQLEMLVKTEALVKARTACRRPSLA